MATKYTAVAFIIIIHVVYGGLPISYPLIPNSVTGGKLVPYNMVDAYPSCYEYGTCPMFPPGGRLSAFPNSEEKYQHTLHNLHRMWGNFTLQLKYAKYKYGANANGGKTAYCKPKDGCDYCGDTRIDLVPLYWYSDANQAARFKQYDENSCDQAWYSEDGNNAHVTCAWVLDEYGGGSHCDLFDGSCEFGPRGSGFCHEDRCWFETEGICGGNTCVTDAHCEPIFANKYDYQGTGFVEGMNGVATVYSRWTKEIWYLLPSGAHFDERMTVVEEDLNPDGKYFTLMLEYFDANRTQKPINCWSLYDESAHEMDVLVSDDWISGDDESRVFGKDAYSVMFTTNHLPPTQCEPYAFICKTSANNFFRLPEESSYYFGTEWIDWKWSDYASYGDGYLCKENHYYYDENEALWVVNGDPNLSKNDIWYYQDTQNYGECIGCSKIATLDCITSCILSDFTDCGECEDAIEQTEPPLLTESENDSEDVIGQTDPPLLTERERDSEDVIIIGQTEPPLLTESESDSDEDMRRLGNAGGIIASVLLALVSFVFIAAYCYYILKTRESICASVSSSTVTKQKPSIIAIKEGDDGTFTNVKNVGDTPSTTVSSIIASFNNNKLNNDHKESVVTVVSVVQQLLCNECQQNKDCNDGEIDENDGLWYCTQCWTEFVE